jgi:hypothetical protein
VRHCYSCIDKVRPGHTTKHRFSSSERRWLAPYVPDGHVPQDAAWWSDAIQGRAGGGPATRLSSHSLLLSAQPDRVLLPLLDHIRAGALSAHEDTVEEAR